MRNIFIIHGSYGYPEENWFPWLKKELEKLGHQVFVPQFPIPKKIDPAYGKHRLKKWLLTLKKYKKYINEKTVFIAHSRGCVFLYHFLTTLDTQVNAVFLIAPWIKYRWYPKGWQKIDSFHKLPFDWKKIKKRSKYFEIYQSTNDDTPVTEGKTIANKLNAKLHVIKNAGHFNIAYSPLYKKFPLLLKSIRLFIKEDINN